MAKRKKPAPAPTPTPTPAPAPTPASATPVHAYYYLWWTETHWRSRLGPNYPYHESPLPLPATTDAAGCSPVTLYEGNRLLDVPPALYSLDDAGVIEGHVRTALAAGLRGFWVRWASSASEFKRIKLVLDAGGSHWLALGTSSGPTPATLIERARALFASYGSHSAWERIDGRPALLWIGSRKYGEAALAEVSSALRSEFFLVGDESHSTLTADRLAHFAGATYYWSSQSPYTNPKSFDHIERVATMVKAAGKRWWAPFAPGYNHILGGGTACVPRNGTDTLATLWNGNRRVTPDGMALISWNEISENTHVEPLQKWGTLHLDRLRELIAD